MTPQETKYLKIGGIAAGAGLMIYLLFGNSKDDGGASTDPTGNTGSPGISNQPFSASRTAEGLYDAMKESGSDDNDIMPYFNSLTSGQLGQVITAFGKRSYNAQLGNQINFNFFISLPLQNLQFWLKNELSADNYKTLKKKYPNQLT